MAGKEFETLALDGSNFPQWAMDIEVGLTTRGLFMCLSAPPAGAPPIPDYVKFGALSIIRNNLHPDVKAEYMYEKNPQVLWESLKQRYEQQRACVLPEATHQWNHLRFQDFKSVDAYNHAVHKLCTKLRFCEKEPTDADKIEKTLSTMLPSQWILTEQYREKGFTVYSRLIQSLRQSEKNHELSVWNSQQRPTGTAPAPLPEVHANIEKNGRDGFKNHSRNHSSKSKRRKDRRSRGSFNKGKGISKPKNGNNNNNKRDTCYRCGCFSHSTRNCRTPKHLADLYMKSVGHDRKTSDKRYEAHFITQEHGDGAKTTSTEAGPSNTTSMHQGETSSGNDKIVVEYDSNDMFGDLN